MTARIRSTSALAALLVFGLATEAAAQVPPNGPPPTRGRQGQRNPGAQQPPPGMQNRVQEQWNAFVLTQSRKFLELSEAQVPNFLAKMMTLQEVRDRHLRDRRRLVMELGRMTAPNNDAQPAEDVLTAKTQALDDLDAQSVQEERVALTAIDDVLTPFQRARFRVFEDRMEERKLEMLEAAKRNVQAGSGRGDAKPTTPAKPIGRGGGTPF